MNVSLPYRRRWWRPLLISVSYLVWWYLLALLARQFEVTPGVSIWFPPTGLDFALLLIFGLRYWPLLFLNSLVQVYLVATISLPFVAVLIYALVTSLGYIGATLLLVRVLRISPQLLRLRDAVWLIIVASFLAPLGVAAVQVLNLVSFGFVPPEQQLLRTLQFWAGDATGVAILTPLLLLAFRNAPLVWLQPANEPPHTELNKRMQRSWLLLVVEGIILAVGIWAAYGAHNTGDLDYTYLVFVPLMWIAVRYGLHGTAAAVLTVNIGAVLLVREVIHVDNVIVLQFGLMIVSQTTMLMGAFITEQQHILEQRVVLERQLQSSQRLESVGRLAGGIAHDFNNLLMGILGNTQLLLDELPKGSSTHATASQIELITRRAAGLAKNLLTYAGRGQVALQPVDLNEVVTEMVSLLKPTLPKQITLQLELAPTSLVVEADATQLRQVLTNLVLNGAEAIGERAGLVTVRTERGEVVAGEVAAPYYPALPPPGVYAALHVADTGTGIAPEILARLFEPFYTTKPKGHGLGLAVVLGIVRGHNGALQVGSVVGAGAHFTVLLPLSSQRPALPPASPIGAVSEAGVAAAVATASILVVDDEAQVRQVVVRMLRRFGYTVLEASGGAAAVAQFEANAAGIDCVLLDYAMPDMNGEQVLLALRAIRPGIPAIVMTGFADEALQRLATMERVSTLLKPFSMQSLAEEVERVLEAER